MACSLGDIFVHMDRVYVAARLCITRGLVCGAQAIIKGDALCLSIAAASIIAKVTRDRIMVDLAQQHPGYGWDRNAGYPTREHVAALQILVSPLRIGVRSSPCTTYCIKTFL